MPRYDFLCINCSYLLKDVDLNTAALEMSKTIPIKCEKCGHEMERQFPTKGNFILKGNGWYSKDNPSKNSKRITKQNINSLEKEQKLALVAQGLEQMTGKNLEEINDLDINKPKTEFNGEQI